MKRSIEEEGRTVEEALRKALERLGLNREEDVHLEILQESQKGLFGLIGSKDARVRVTEIRDSSDLAHEFIEGIVDIMGLDISVDRLEEETTQQNICLNLRGSNLGILIGRRGQTLDALQYLTTVIVNKENDGKYQRVLLDAEGYRKRRKQTLENLARRLAEKVREKGRKVFLEPMPPHERRIIHLTLRNNPHVRTYSEGQEPYRKVVIGVRV